MKPIDAGVIKKPVGYDATVFKQQAQSAASTSAGNANNATNASNAADQQKRYQTMAKPLPPLGTGVRFQQLTSELAARGARNPKALAAYIGRKKYGKTRFQQLANPTKTKRQAAQQAVINRLKGGR